MADNGGDDGPHEAAGRRPDAAEEIRERVDATAAKTVEVVVLTVAGGFLADGYQNLGGLGVLAAGCVLLGLAAWDAIRGDQALVVTLWRRLRPGAGRSSFARSGPARTSGTTGGAGPAGDGAPTAPAVSGGGGTPAAGGDPEGPDGTAGGAAPPTEQLAGSVEAAAAGTAPSSRARLLLAVTIGVVLAVVVFAVFAGPPLYRTWVLGLCGHPTEFTVVTTEADHATAEDLLAAYERDDADDNHGCPSAIGYAYETDAESLRTGIAQNWQPNGGPITPSRDIGTRPDLWLTTSSLATHRLATVAPEDLLDDPGPIATSPVVVAVPGPEGPLGGAVRTWNGLLDDPALPDVVRPDPQRSMVGALATAGLYGADVDRTHTTAVDVSSRDSRAIESAFSRAATRTGYPRGTESDLVCRLRTTGAGPAVVMSEQSMVRFNLGRPVDQCPAADQPPGSSLHAFYPRNAALDQRSVLLRWPGRSTPAGQAAEDFDHWLRSEGARDALHCAGLRPIGGGAPTACPWTGTLTRVAAFAPDVADDVVDGTVLPQQRQAEPRRRTLLLVDDSGSMATALADGRSRSAEVLDAASATLPALRHEDEIGLRLFPGDARATGSREAVAPGPADDPLGGATRRGAVLGALTTAGAAGNTPLYTSVIESVDALKASSIGQVDDLVLVTDGDDTSSRSSASDVLTALRTSAVQLRVVLLGGDVTCAAPLFRDLGPAALGTCDDAGTASVNDAMRRIVAG